MALRQRNCPQCNRPVYRNHHCKTTPRTEPLVRMPPDFRAQVRQQQQPEQLPLAGIDR